MESRITTPDAALAGPRQLGRQASPTRRMLGRLLRHRGAIVGGGVILLIALTALLAPMIAPYDPADVGVGPSLQGPSREHVMGTDTFGRDIFSRVVFGAQLSLQVGVLAV